MSTGERGRVETGVCLWLSSCVTLPALCTYPTRKIQSQAQKERVWGVGVCGTCAVDACADAASDAQAAKVDECERVDSLLYVCRAH